MKHSYVTPFAAAIMLGCAAGSASAQNRRTEDDKSNMESVLAIAVGSKGDVSHGGVCLKESPEFTGTAESDATLKNVLGINIGQGATQIHGTYLTGVSGAGTVGSKDNLEKIRGINIGG